MARRYLLTMLFLYALPMIRYGEKIPLDRSLFLCIAIILRHVFIYLSSVLFPPYLTNGIASLSPGTILAKPVLEILILDNL